MRPIYMVALDKYRPAVLITREEVLDFREQITVAPITGTVRGMSTEVLVGPANGIDKGGAVHCDDLNTVRREKIGQFVGYLHDDQEGALAEAIIAGFDLDV